MVVHCVERKKTEGGKQTEKNEQGDPVACAKRSEFRKIKTIKSLSRDENQFMKLLSCGLFFLIFLHGSHWGNVGAVLTS